MALNFANNNSLSSITSLPASISGGALTLLQTQTASSSSTIDFTSNIDSTYDVYCFKFINIHPQTDVADFSFNMSTDGGSNYNVSKTTTYFTSAHAENDSAAEIGYAGSQDLASSTSDAQIFRDLGSDNDQCLGGEFFLFNPSNTTFTKHFICTIQGNNFNNFTETGFTSGIGNTTSAINGIRFKFSSGNIDSGDIKLYGIS